jgi:hypothetical protein
MDYVSVGVFAFAVVAHKQKGQIPMVFSKNYSY